MHLKSSRFRCAAAGALAMSLVSFVAPATAIAQRAGGAIDSLARAFKAENHLPALVIGVVSSEGEKILPYGVVGADGTPATADTRFEIGSITKVFTSLLLADMVDRGEVSLDDPIAHYLPDSVGAPEYRGQQITLRELATHTSSLPRLPTNIAPADMSDPYADYTADQLYAFLDSYDLSQAPDTHYEYSNLGAGLLGFLLSRHAGTPYAKLLQERVIQPLGLADSYVAQLGGGTDERMAQGHAGGKPVAYWHFGTLEGAGGVRSTANDLLHLLSVELHPAKAPLSSAIELSQKIRYRVSPQLALALGWHVVPLSDSTSFFWHNGGTGGARSFVGFAPEAGVGIVLLTNEALPLEAVNQFAFEVARAALEP